MLQRPPQVWLVVLRKHMLSSPAPLPRSALSLYSSSGTKCWSFSHLSLPASSWEISGPHTPTFSGSTPAVLCAAWPASRSRWVAGSQEPSLGYIHLPIPLCLSSWGMKPQSPTATNPLHQEHPGAGMKPLGPWGHLSSFPLQMWQPGSYLPWQ